MIDCWVIVYAGSQILHWIHHPHHGTWSQRVHAYLGHQWAFVFGLCIVNLWFVLTDLGIVWWTLVCRQVLHFNCHLIKRFQCFISSRFNCLEVCLTLLYGDLVSISVKKFILAVVGRLLATTYLPEQTLLEMSWSLLLAKQVENHSRMYWTNRTWLVEE